MSVNDSDRIRYWAKKIKYINYLGGKCSNCGNANIHILDFHHKLGSNKKYLISQKIESLSFEEIVEELDKCVLLCRNCHREKHFKTNNVNNKFKELKIEHIKLLDIQKCNNCGYDACNDALEFHHINQSTKKFNISNGKASKFISFEVIEELKKCIILCANCHKLVHSDLNFFNSHYEEIINKSNDLQYKKLLNLNDLMDLYSKGYGVKEISKLLNKNESTISTALKRMGVPPSFTFVNNDDIIRLHKEGLSNIEIATKLNRNKATIFRLMKKLQLIPNKSINEHRKNFKNIDYDELFKNISNNSISEVSRMMNISRQTIYNILNNKR